MSSVPFWSTRRRVLLCVASIVGIVAVGFRARAQVIVPLFAPSATVAARTAAADPTAIRSREVTVQIAQLAAPASRTPDGGIELNLFADATVTATFDRLDTSARGYVWNGHVADVPMSTVTLAVEGATVFGSVFLPGATYVIKPAGDGLATIVEVDQSRFGRELEPLEPTNVAPRPQAPAQPAAPGAAADVQGDNGSVIDVMVLYTPAAATAAGGTTGINTLIANAISTSNTAYGNSGVVQRLRLAHAAQVAYTESGIMQTDLSALTNGTGAFTSVPGLRDAYRADVVTLLTHTSSSAYCGLAWLMTTVSTGFAPNGYSVVEQSCAVGNLTFPHELGHNMGLLHDWFVDAGVLPQTYAHGYVNTTARWRTIMAYNDRCAALGFSCTRLPYWSNPGVQYLGAPMGIAGGTSSTCTAGVQANCDADDHRMLNESANAVSNFRQALTNGYALNVDFGPGIGLWSYLDGGGWQALNNTSPSVLTRADVDFNGIVEPVVVLPGQGVWAYMNGTTWTLLHPFDAADIKAGDVDGNGRDDLAIIFPGLGLWVRYDSGAWVQLHGFTPTKLALGNLDGGTGRADVIVNFTGFGVWSFMNNTSWVQLHGTQALDLKTGDIDGNGQADLVVQFPSFGEWLFMNNSTWTWLHGAAASGITIGNIDNDAPHKSDIILNFPGAGVWAYRNNATWAQLHPFNAPVMAAGDLDGNGQDDVAVAFPGYGIYVFKNNTTWTYIHPTMPELLASGR